MESGSRSRSGEYFTFSDICAGIGGMRLAFEKLGGKCVFASEWDRFCQQTYTKNFGDLPQGDIMKIPIKKIPKHDILLAGFPCQPFSAGGIATRRLLKKQSGFADMEQGRIFFRIMKIISGVRPRAVLLENVPALMMKRNGRTLHVMKQMLEKLGYGVSHKVICSQGLVPQRRCRIYIVALENRQELNFPETPDLKPVLRQILQKRVSERYTLSDKLWSWLQEHSEKHKRQGNGYGYRLADLNGLASTLSARYGKDGSEILIPQRGKNPRKLTPRECARLMGFPDSYSIPVSDTQAYRQFGNSVIVPVIEILGRQIIDILNENQAYAIACR